MPDGGRAERMKGGLRITDVRPEDQGLYFCQANNDLGSVRASAHLSVYCEFCLSLLFLHLKLVHS